MAQFNVTHTCGHTINHNLFGKSDERTRKIGWLKTVACLDCTRTAERAAAQQQADTQHLPALIGSDKHVVWAITIRATMLTQIDTFVADSERKATATGQTDKIAAMHAMVAPLIAKVRAQTSAAWWIDRRNTSAQQLLREVQ